MDKQYDEIDKIGIKGYSQIYVEECKYIWKNFVPKCGQANNVQGEMLRQSVKLRNEACNNGNINWDDNFEWFCDFLKNTLSQSGIFDKDKNNKLKQVLEYIKSNGKYAKKYANGEINDTSCDIVHLAYVYDDLYDYLDDAIAEYYINHKEPIPYFGKNFIFR